MVLGLSGHRLAMRFDRVGCGLVAIGLAGLGEQDQRRSVGSLRRKGEVEQDEGIGIGVPKKRAARSAARPNLSCPNAPVPLRGDVLRFGHTTTLEACQDGAVVR
jgi:hypothetical protein